MPSIQSDSDARGVHRVVRSGQTYVEAFGEKRSVSIDAGERQAVETAHAVFVFDAEKPLHQGLAFARRKKKGVLGRKPFALESKASAQLRESVDGDSRMRVHPVCRPEKHDFAHLELYLPNPDACLLFGAKAVAACRQRYGIVQSRSLELRVRVVANGRREIPRRWRAHALC
jgi:hypothetical protein